MKKLFVLILNLALVIAAVCVPCGTASSSFADTPAAYATPDNSEIISAIRGDFKGGNVSDDFAIGGNYETAGGLLIKDGFIRTEKKARYFLVYAEIYAENSVIFTVGEKELTINLKDSCALFGGETENFAKKNYGGDPLLLRVEAINGVLTVGIKAPFEASDSIYKNVASFGYDAGYVKLGFKTGDGAAELFTFRVFAYDSNFTPEHHDYDEITDAVPERVKKPVKNPKNGSLAIWLAAGGGALVLIVGAVVLSVALSKKKRRQAKGE